MQEPLVLQQQAGSADRAPVPAASSRERSLDRVVQMLDFLHAHGSPIAVAELSRQLGAPRSTTYNLVRSLTEAGLLEETDGRVFFGKKLYLYGMDYSRENALVRRGREAVDRLSRETGETAELCTLQNGRYTIIYMCPGTRPFRISSAVGLQIPLPWTASGRLLLAGSDRAAVEALVPEADRFLPDGRRVELDDFIASIEEADRLGYCITSGLVDAVTMCLAAPVYDEKSRVEATLCFVVPIDTSKTRTDELLSRLLAEARQVSLGSREAQGRRGS
ncbi:IclR family transcriptional regulator [Mangrovicella endophytica]|uniref:IclR family transcriptional regulator n=1 Tax=Mangrovicella endophytica TaxID=2066697 RepID=UPI000C9E8090|nr:IclR family transcriptional regulator [Mangrovicella endophytica]